MRKIVPLFFLFLPLFHNAQVPVDSLEQLMNMAQGEEQLRLMITVGNMYSSIDPEKGLEYGLKAAFSAKRIGNNSLEGQALLLMGLSSFNLGQYENALRYYNRALVHYERTNNADSQIKALDGISKVYEATRNLDLAIRHLERAQNLAKNLNQKKLQIEIHQRLGKIALEQNNYTRANNEFSNVITLLGNESKLDRQGLTVKASTLRRIGNVHRNLGLFNESLNSFRESSRIEESLNSIEKKMHDFFEIAYTYYLLQNFDSSLVYYNQVLAHNQLKNDTTLMIQSLEGIGNVFFELEQYRQAVASYNLCLELSVKNSNVQAQIASLVKISRCYNAFNDYPSSKIFLSRALDIAKKEGLSTSAADVYKYLSLLSEAEGKYMQALEYYKQWSDIRDSLYTEESGQKLARLQILYEITQKERENEILRQNSQIQELQLTKTRYQRMVFIALALFLFTVLVLLILYFSVKQKEFLKQKETELRIVEMNKELEKRMISEIKKQEKQQLLLAQKSKLESLGTLAAGIAHEINQPLGGISMGLDNVLIKASENNLTEGYLKEKLNLIFENVDRIKRIIDHIRTFSRTQKPATFEKVDINQVIENALSMVRTQFANQGIKLEVNLTEGCDKVVGDKYKLEQVVLNLVGNAKFAVDEKQKLTNDKTFEKRISIKSNHDSENVYFSVFDNGIGIKQKDIEKIFDPFFTTKREDKGTGLGLSISYGFIKDILGEIKVESQENEFTRFDVIIPKS